MVTEESIAAYKLWQATMEPKNEEMIERAFLATEVQGHTDQELWDFTDRRTRRLDTTQQTRHALYKRKILVKTQEKRVYSKAKCAVFRHVNFKQEGDTFYDDNPTPAVRIKNTVEWLENYPAWAQISVRDVLTHLGAK